MSSKIVGVGKLASLALKRRVVAKYAKAEPIVHEYEINKKAKVLHPDMQELVVHDVIDHGAAGAKSFIFVRADRKLPAYFRAGQYLSIKFPVGDSFVTRPYSISSSPKWARMGKIAITIKTNPGEGVANYLLENLKVGDHVYASGGEGQFCYESLRDEKNVIALAGGSGITPFLSMAYAIRDGIEDFNLTIIFGSRTVESILFKAELDAIAKECDKVKVVHVLSEEKKRGYENGFITSKIIKKYAGDEPYSVFICGPEAMYRFLEKEIAKLDIPKKNIRREVLGVTKNVAAQEGYPTEKAEESYTITVKQGPDEYTITAKASEPVLVAVERAGIKAPSKCRSGECGWCRSKVVSGEYFVPEETDGRRWADKQTDYIHPCATFPLSDMVIEVPGEYY